jgi:hypothetical protein
MRGEAGPGDRGVLRTGRVRPFVPALLAALGAAGAVDPARAAEPGRTFEVYGIAQADAIADTKRVDPLWEDTFRPSKIGVDGQYGTDGQSSVSVKQSRFGVKGVVATDAGGAPIDFKFEFDLFGTGADEGQTTFHLRYFYGEWRSLLVGQADSVFRDGGVFPNLIDYWGPTGFVDKRNPQIRWTAVRTATDRVAIAIEKPGNDVDPGNIRLIEEYQYAEVRSDEKLPDLTIQYRREGGWGHLQVAGILRRVGYEYRATSSDPWRQGSAPGWGVNLSAGIDTIGKDRLLLQVVHGRGIATYMCDGGMDIAPNADPTVATLSAEAVPLTGVLAYYDHYWNDTWSSSIGYSFTQVENTNFQSPTTYHRGDYASVNLLATPAAQVLLGGELLWGRRTNHDGASGDDVRVQLTVKYKFGAVL